MEHVAYAYCSCGQLGLVVDEPEDGQCLFGTAAFKALRHEEDCSGSATVFPAWREDGNVEVMTGEMPTRQSQAVRTGGMYHG